MTAVFADTSYYLAFLSPADQWHEAALAWAGRTRGPLVTSEFVLVEVGNALNRKDDRALFLELLDVIRADAGTAVEPASSSLLEAGIALFRDRPDKTWSVTDCISFALMTRLGLTDALSADRHFVQAGFRAFLLEPAA